MWNKYMILIDNPYHSPTKHNPNGKFCPMGIIDRTTYCIMPCFFFDSQYCTYWMSSYSQEKAAKDWRDNNVE